MLVAPRFPLAVAAELRGHTGPVNALVWSPYPSNANQLLTGGDDHTLNLWSVNSSPTRRTLGTHAPSFCISSHRGVSNVLLLLLVLVLVV
jgi:WD40 repeat protein